MYPNIDMNWQYVVTGFGEQYGNLQRICKKLSSHEHITEETRKAIKEKLGDMSWYLAMICCEFGFLFDEVTKDNLIKLEMQRKTGIFDRNESEG